MQPPSITRIVAALEEKGYVERTVVAAKRRVSTVTITTKGRRELRSIRTERNAWLAGRLAVLERGDEQCPAWTTPSPVLERMFESDA